MKLDRKQDLNVLCQVCVFRDDRKNKMVTHPLIVWDILDFSFETVNGIQRNMTERKIRRSSTKFMYFGRSEKQDDRPGLWLIEAFSTSPLKLMNGIQQNLIESKISTSSTTFISGKSVKNNGGPGLRVKKVAHCTQVHDVCPFGTFVKCMSIWLHGCCGK